MQVDIGANTFKVRLTWKQWGVLWAAAAALALYVVRSETEFAITRYRLDECEQRLKNVPAKPLDAGRAGVPFFGAPIGAPR